ncbi:caspase family protein, partial [Undibacterium sp. Di24W]|uniref:caspase family protein n=1 Tax=Undibacterium sp. Di24W TaxID=3413033 RepID=UPI003BEF7D49
IDADPKELKLTSIGKDVLKRKLASLRGKILFFFDSCYSGAILGSNDTFGNVNGVINELSSAENGWVVFSSSTGTQKSYEDPVWGNGAFTKALLEGIDGAADFGKTGKVTYKMLDLYISGRVSTLTEGTQTPVTQAPGGVVDFPISVKMK